MRRDIWKYYLVIVILGLAWVGVGYASPPIGVGIALVHLVCILLDAGMNGAAYAEFVPFNLIGAALVLLGAGLGS